MSATTITIPNIQLTLDDLISAIRQLDVDARTEVLRALMADEIDATYAQLIARLSSKQAADDITDREIDTIVHAVRTGL